jgi:hypothetical protein
MLLKLTAVHLMVDHLLIEVHLMAVHHMVVHLLMEVHTVDQKCTPIATVSAEWL